VKRIDILPDDVLLEIFDFYKNMYRSYGGKMEMEAWESLVHVCRRWRSLVFGSPRRLNLQLFCTPETPAKDRLDVRPALPLIVAGNMALSSGTDNIIAALGQTNRVREVFLQGLADWQLEEVLAAMEVPFPELTELQLWSAGESPPVIPVPCPTSAIILRIVWHSLSGIANSAFVCYSPCLPQALQYPAFLVHFTRGDVCSPLHFAQP
jgi:hypothetical protein